MSDRWDGGILLQPIAPDRPCGADVEYTVLPSFDAYRLFGQTAEIDPAPDWAKVRDQALDGLSQSKDLRLLAYLGAASLRTAGLREFATTLSIAAEWLAAYWAQVYPPVDEDAMVRRSALNCLADQVAIIDALRRVPLVSSRQHGTFSLRDIDIATGQMQSAKGETPADEGQINAALAAMPLDELIAQQASVAAALAALKRIDATMAAEAGPDAVPGFDTLSVQLSKIDRVFRTQLAARGNAPAVAADGSEASPPGQAASPVTAVGGITSRQEAIRALDAVAEFFRRNEPSSPVPLFIERAKRLVSKNFLEVLADIAPEGLAQARSVGGVPESE
jgi:type VI secretion system protein ImpA